jgi:hypothetical protein
MQATGSQPASVRNSTQSSASNASAIEDERALDRNREREN